MSLGLSLTASTNPSQLLVSCPRSQAYSEGRSGDLGMLKLGVLWRVEVLAWEGEMEAGASPPTNSLCLQACGPTVHHACRENMYLSGFCFLLSFPSRRAQRLPSALQGECSGHQVCGEPTHI